MCFPIWCPCAGPYKSVRRISISSVPCSTFARCSVCFAIEDNLPSMGVNGRHSTIDCQERDIRQVPGMMCTTTGHKSRPESQWGSRQPTTSPASSRRSTTMAESQRYQNRIELLQGTLDLLILQTLARGNQHGHGISQIIRARSGELLSVETGSLYPALHRLEKKGWLDSEWKASENNQRAKYYSLTKAGKKQLEAEHEKWRQLV